MITVIGSVNMDLVVNLPEIPRVGETVNGGTFLQNPGGKGANQAVAAAKLGSDVHFIGCLGDDGFGTELREKLHSAGVHTDGLETAENCSSGIALIQVDSHGRNNIAVASGANYAVTKETIDRHVNLLAKKDIAVFQLEILMDVNRYAMQKAREAGCTVILNPSPVAELTPDIFANVDVMVPNEHELARITGLPCETEEQVLAAARVLQSRGVSTVVVTLGEKGAMYVTETAHALLPAFRVKAVDTTAAGDAFLGGFAHAYEKTRDVAEAVRLGQKVASIAVQRPGAQQSMPTAAELAEA